MEVPMSGHPQTSGFNHVATMTADLDRYLAFYGKIFGEEGGRHRGGGMMIRGWR